MDEQELKKVVREIIGTEHTLEDCAIFSCGDELLVATTDMLHEQTDFPPGITDWQIGWMSAAVTLSDIAAMGARPEVLLLAIGLDRSGRLREILEGAQACCRSCGTSVAGGDLDSHHELTLVSSGVGFSTGGTVVRRRGAQLGDLIGITGPLGRAQAALDGYHQYERFLFEPIPKVKEGQLLAKAGVSSMMDISDGLVSSLHDLMEANSCGYSVDSKKLPLLPGITEKKSREYGLYGGGDYELLFTVQPEKLATIGDENHVIGRVIEERVVRIDGIPVERRGYQHHWLI